MTTVYTSPMRVFVIAPPMVCWGLERLVQTASRMELAGSANSVDSACDALQKSGADLVVAGIHAPDEFEALAGLARRTSARFLIVTNSRDTDLLDNAMLAGARGVVRMDDPPAVLLKAIEKVHGGELWIDRAATARIFLEMARQKAAPCQDPDQSKIATLTSRERQTIAAVTSDASAPAKVIARRLCISEHTLRNHLTSIYSKLEVSSRLDLYAYAYRHHLASDGARMQR
jgi:two-component system, NarL family, nitrate/nitrite response regulator NarL